MPQLSGFDSVEVQFTKAGMAFDSTEVARAVELVQQQDGITDLLVIAHGWNNDMREARGLYQRFFAEVRAVLDRRDLDGLGGLGGRTFAVLGVLWPSKRFAEEERIPSGAASVGSPVSDEALQAQLDDLKGVFDAPDADVVLERAKRLIPVLEDSERAQREFADLLRSLVPQLNNEPDEDAVPTLFALPGEEVMRRLARPVLPPGPAAAGMGGAAGGGAGIGQRFSGPRSAARNLANFTTYYQMKERAGIVGKHGVHGVLAQLRQVRPDLRLHLIGHSFGGRLVAAAALGPANQPAVRPHSMTLLQAAFSHHGFAQRFDGRRDGFFRKVISDQMVDGPVIITHTRNDQAVGVAYPLAALLDDQVAAALGDANDPRGAIGRNGAQKTPEAVAGILLAVGQPYAFTRGRPHNLLADAFIHDHSAVANPQVAYAVMAAVATT